MIDGCFYVFSRGKEAEKGAGTIANGSPKRRKGNMPKIKRDDTKKKKKKKN